MSTITTVDPATGQALDTYATHDQDSVEHIISRSADQARSWAARTVAERAKVVRRVGELLRAERKDLATLITQEMGKPITEALGEIDKCALTADYYADHGEALLADQTVEVAPAKAWVAHEPLGVVLAIMPWNFPFWQVMRAALPALTAGNGLVLKHSPNSTGAALRIERLLLKAGLPEGLFGTLVVEEPRVPQVIDSLISDDRVQAVTLTGSNRAGSAVGALAGREIKKSVLELGGSDAFVVLSDADLDTVVPSAVRARYTNTGQSCVCAKRFIIDQSIAEEFTERFVESVKSLIVGAPLLPHTQVGPMARPDLREVLDDQVRRSLDQGARLLIGGKALEGPGNFFAPTVLSETGPGVAAFDEEVFGPVAALATARDDEHAIALANATIYGLGASVWSNNTERALEVARGVRSGAVFINAIVASDPRVPFGGVGKSGYGRELGSYGLREFTNTRTYWRAG